MGKVVKEMIENIVWKCPNCEDETIWEYRNLALLGSPVCPLCDCDMEWEGDEDD
ncbi:hypothetical protein M0R72_20950 [Candidatus Pacearchaeota archaeon]|nr:hypothetical protein [Candidatus Pacearchaeota archaeon]